MLISHTHKFIFIHVYKVAGNSIANTLYKYTVPPHEKMIYYLMQKLNLMPASTRLPRHARAIELKSLLSPRQFNNYFKFAFVRNPWDWQVSLYNYMLRDEKMRFHDLVSGMDNFEAYLDWMTKEEHHHQREFIEDDNGNLLVDFVGRYESLQEDFDTVVDHIGLEREELKYMNKSEHDDYRKYYNKQSRELIAHYFREDVRLFDYTF